MSGPGYTYGKLQLILGAALCDAIIDNPDIADAVKDLVTRMIPGQQFPDMSDTSFPERQSSGNASPSQLFLATMGDDLIRIFQRIPMDPNVRPSFLSHIGLRSDTATAEKLLKICGKSDFFSGLLVEARSFPLQQLRKFLVALGERAINTADRITLAKFVDSIPKDQQ
jgi:hypothetical protein